jgi:hypothetical protein
MQDIPCLKILLSTSSTSYREIFRIEQFECRDFFEVFRIRIRILLGQRIRILCPDPGRSKLAPKKERRNFMFEESEWPCRDLIRHAMYDGFLSKKNSNNKFCLLFFIINIGQRIRIGSILSNRLDPDPDSAKYWIRIQWIRMRNTGFQCVLLIC